MVWSVRLCLVSSDFFCVLIEISSSRVCASMTSLGTMVDGRMDGRTNVRNTKYESCCSLQLVHRTLSVTTTSEYFPKSLKKLTLWKDEFDPSLCPQIGVLQLMVVIDTDAREQRERPVDLPLSH